MQLEKIVKLNFILIIMALFVIFNVACGGNEALEKENDTLKKENSQLKKQNSQLKAELTTSKSEAAPARLGKEIDKAQDDLGKWQEKLKVAESKNEEQSNIIQKNTEEIEFMRGEIEKLEKDTADKDAAIQEKEQLKLENEHLAMDLENARKEANLSRGEIDKLKKDAAELQKAYAKYAESIRAQAANEAINAIKNKAQNEQFYAQEINKLRTKLAEAKEPKKKEDTKKSSADNLASGLKKDLAKEEASGDVSVESIKGKIFVSITSDVMFNVGEHELKKEALGVLNKIGKQLKNNPDRSIIIEGHTDDVPISSKGKKKYKSNWELSTFRATEVVHYLIDNHNIAPKRIMAGGRSKYYPAAANDTDENRAKNRRVRIIIGPYDPTGNEIFSEKYNGANPNSSGGETPSEEVYGGEENGIELKNKNSKLETKTNKNIVTDEGENRSSDDTATSDSDIEVYGSEEM